MTSGTEKIRVDGVEMKIVPGTPLQEILANHGFDRHEDPPVLAVVNGQRLGLNESLWGGETVGLMRASNRKSHSAVVRTLSAVLALACEELHPGRSLVLDFSYGGGLYGELRGEPAPDAEAIAAVAVRMREIIARDLDLTPRVYSLRALARETAKAPAGTVFPAMAPGGGGPRSLLRVNGSRLLFSGLHLPGTGTVGTFALVPETPGFVLLPCLPGRPGAVTEYAPQPALLAVMRRHALWARQQGLSDLASINREVAEGRVKELIRLCEGRHENRIVGIAERIATMPSGRKIVFVAGPSSSGKTTFAKRLALQLRVLGMRPRALSLDDYFKDRDKTPRNEKGEYDFEALAALRLDRLGEDLAELIDGGIVTPPRFDFQLGRSLPGDEPLALDDNAPLIVEGIHALNPGLAPSLPRERSLCIYVSALTNTNLDAFTPTRTNLVRLFRRIVRDSQFRGYTASDTLQRWPSVRDGEQKHIFPYQCNADVFFNSGLAYELGVLKLWAEPRLAAVPPDDPAYGKALALLELTGLHLPIDARLVPPTSLLREFIGESGFSY